MDKLRDAQRTSAPPRAKVAPVEPAIEFFVAPSGSDRAPGTRERPFASLARAREALRERKKTGWPAGGAAVTLLPGEYPIQETFELTAGDSGAEGAPVTYRSETPGAAVLYGGVRLRGFSPVEDPAILARLPEEARGHVCQCDLKAQGITGYPPLEVRGMGQPPPPPTLELYFDGRPMTLARWPNEGFVEVKRLIEPGEKGKTPSIFEYESDRHARWTQAEDGWLFGYFKWLWADSTLPIGSIDPRARTLTTAEPYDYHGGMDTTQGILYYAFNLLEEIDTPGEWYLDRKRGILYFWPPSDPEEAVVEIGLLDGPMVRLRDVTHVRFEGLVFDLGRCSGLAATECSHCLIAGCAVRRFAGNGVTFDGGRECGILGCDIETLGRRGAEVIGGDRKRLVPGGHFVENCRIHDFGRIDRTYTPAIQLEGVGNRVAHNLLYDGPSSALRIEGNDHLVEYNQIHHTVRESDDQGAIDVFYNPTYRGLVFRYNLFHHIGKTGAEKQVHGQAAVRLDDAISGALVYGNLFYRSSNGNFGAVQINSGRDNCIENNLFVECRYGVSGGWNPDNEVWKSIREGRPREDFYLDDLYLSRYPELARMMESPGINHLRRNLFYRCGPMLTRSEELFELQGNRACDEDPGFADPENGDFRLRPDAALHTQADFEPIPIERIGLYEDRYRTSADAKAE